MIYFFVRMSFQYLVLTKTPKGGFAMKKREVLGYKEALMIINFVANMVESLKINGTAVIVDRGGIILAAICCGEARPMTFTIALNKALQAAYTGARTGDIAKKIASGERTMELYGINPKTFVPFAGGCPIYSKGGKLLGGAGFSEQTAKSDEDIVCTALENCGFASDTPLMSDVSSEEISKASDIATDEPAFS